MRNITMKPITIKSIQMCYSHLSFYVERSLDSYSKDFNNIEGVFERFLQCTISKYQDHTFWPSMFASNKYAR